MCAWGEKDRGDWKTHSSKLDHHGNMNNIFLLHHTGKEITFKSEAMLQLSLICDGCHATEI